MGLSAVCSSALIFAVVLFREFFAGLFTADAAVIESACVRILCILLYEPVCNFYEIPAGVLRGSGHALYPAAATVVGNCAFRIAWMKGNAGVPLSPPPYGYIKNPDDPRFWVVEPEAAEVVRRIYRMALEGYGLAETAAQLAADGVVNPTYYWRSRGTSRGGSKSTVEPTKWGHTTVKKILTLQECSCTVRKQATENKR